jgi:hypothetical protein
MLFKNPINQDNFRDLLKMYATGEIDADKFKALVVTLKNIDEHDDVPQPMTEREQIEWENYQMNGGL